MKAIRYLYRAKVYHRSGYNRLEVWAKNYEEAEEYFNTFDAGHSEITNISKREFNLQEPTFVSSAQRLDLNKRLKEFGLDYSDVVLYKYASQTKMDKIRKLHRVLKADSVLFEAPFQAEIFNISEDNIVNRIREKYVKRKALQRKRNG